MTLWLATEHYLAPRLICHVTVENGYSALVNNRIINVRHVQVVEENTKLICLNKNDDQKDRDLENSKSIIVQNETYETESEINKNNSNKNKTNLDNIRNYKINEEYSNFYDTNEKTAANCFSRMLS